MVQRGLGVDTETDENGVILAGHDAVAYFTQGKPVLGKANFTAVHNDAIYRFSSEENRDMFVSNPDKYALKHMADSVLMVQRSVRSLKLTVRHLKL